MKYLRYILTAIILTLIFSSFVNPNIIRTEFENDRFESIYQFSYSHGELGRDSVVLTRENSDEMYNRIKIYRGKKLIFEYGDENIQIEGFPFNLFVEHEISGYKEYFYIFNLFNAPDPSRFLIIKTDKEKTTYFGTTKSSTAEIFGDIDNDNKFEIGGYEYYGFRGVKDNLSNLFNVFEIDTDFPTDTILTNCVRKINNE